ncbi:MAG: hypothetical protein ACD_2C00016G0014 [uncultured bacterium (gcode 4)]|uniref:Methyltransferase domain-containing protein n=1 Tax=uncultured bacterium (gcode 4) TaxID=1234023 RepID=K2G4S7_9BACT|nr:MAG: hypothetical protein ACD_2C00016G0014 [uncultured bacterium (gcode 4)]
MSLERQSPKSIEEAEATHFARYEFAKDFIKKEDLILDCPCGSWYWTFALSIGWWKCIGIDNSSIAIEHANAFFKNEKTEYVIWDMEALGLFLNVKFNLIVSFEWIEHINKQEQFLDEAKELLSDDWIFLISTPRKPHWNIFHIKELELGQFIDMLEERFAIKWIYTQIYTEIAKYDDKRDYWEYKKLNYIAICTKK